MKGHRLPDETDWSGKLAHGTYWRRNDRWYCITPVGQFGDLSKHAIAEHEDGTITVSPSILVTGGGESWHGFLECGLWREC